MYNIIWFFFCQELCVLISAQKLLRYLNIFIILLFLLENKHFIFQTALTAFYSLASCGSDGLVKLWNIEIGQFLRFHGLFYALFNYVYFVYIFEIYDFTFKVKQNKVPIFILYNNKYLFISFNVFYL